MSRKTRSEEKRKQQAIDSLNHQTGHKWYFIRHLFQNCLSYFILYELCAYIQPVSRYWRDCAIQQMEHEPRLDLFGAFSQVKLYKILHLAERHMIHLKSLDMRYVKYFKKRHFDSLTHVLDKNPRLVNISLVGIKSSLFVSTLIQHAATSVQELLIEEDEWWDIHQMDQLVTALQSIRQLKKLILSFGDTSGDTMLQQSIWKIKTFGSQLTYLWLESPFGSGDCLHYIAKNCPLLQSLLMTIKETSSDRDEDWFSLANIETLSKHCPDIEHLVLQGDLIVSGHADPWDEQINPLIAYPPRHALMAFAALKKCTCLRLPNGNIDVDWLLNMWEQMPQLKFLSIESFHCHDLSTQPPLQTLAAKIGHQIEGLFIRESLEPTAENARDMAEHFASACPFLLVLDVPALQNLSYKDRMLHPVATSHVTWNHRFYNGYSTMYTPSLPPPSTQDTTLDFMNHHLYTFCNPFF